jgi:hypothetical protein
VWVETNHFDDVHLATEMPKSANPVASCFHNQRRDLMLQSCRDNKTAIELFLSGIKALALQSSIIDVARIASRFSTATG